MNRPKSELTSACVRAVHKVRPGQKIALKEIDPGNTCGVTKEQAETALGSRNERLDELQALVNAASSNGVLIILQGLDASGKDGTIRHVMQQVNPQGCKVVSFKEPTALELRHDFLWRVHHEVPEKGIVTIFNRSHYEDVLVTKVHGLVPAERIEKRYDAIKQFESLLVEEGTLVLKFFLHISKKEQKKRLLERESDPKKAYKVAPSDWAERKFWSDYRGAYETALTRTSTTEAPWYVVPSDHKWFRNLAIAEIVVARLAEEEARWKSEVIARGKKALAAAAH